MQKLIQRGASAASWERPEGMSALVHGLLQQRGVTSAQEAEDFLHPRAEHLHDPYLLSGMSAAVERILRARANAECVCVFGDYDVDGVSASSILTLYFKALEMDVKTYIPSRHEEGYGLNERAIVEIAKDASLLVTVDCGISCSTEVRLAQELGMDVIVTDHHRPGDRLPDCITVNPLLENYPFPYLCGAGVALKLVMALGAAIEREEGEIVTPAGWSAAGEYVDLAALATVADLVSLTGENRVIVSLGLERINENPRLGVKALIHASGMEGKTISAGNIGFQLAPRLNASGRLGDAMRAMELLTAEDEFTAETIAAQLEDENTERKSCEQKIVDEALEKMAQYDLLDHRIIVIKGEGWNSGVIGLAASRLATKYFYPVVLLAEKDGVCTGSCRSIPGVDIFAALSSCADLFVKFGGHRQAAGLTIESDKVEEMLLRLDDYLMENVHPDEYIPQMEYDLELDLGEVTLDAVRQMELLQPTGFGNPSPVLLSRVSVESARAVGKEGAHLQMRLSDGANELSAICFGEGARAGELAGEVRHMLYAPQINVWRDRVNVQCEVKNVLENDSDAVFARFGEKYSRYLRTYLTEMLYNIELHSPTVSFGAVPTVNRSLLSEWLSESPQGTVIAVASREGARSLRSFLKAEKSEQCAEVHIGRWSSDKRAFNSVSLCPVGKAEVRFERVVLWDAPECAFSHLPQGEVYRMDERVEGDWMGQMPDVKRLREIFVSLRSLTRSGTMVRMSGADIDNEAARASKGNWIEAAMALAVLRSMELIGKERERLYMLPVKKADPTDNILWKRLNIICGRIDGGV